jgi:sodium/proline symporter
MVVSMTLLTVIAINECHGFSGLYQSLYNIDPKLLNPFDSNLKYGFIIFFLSLLVNGIGVIGQPHVMLRAMAIKSVKSMNLARNIYLSGYLIFSLTAGILGLASRVLMQNQEIIDMEMTLPILSMNLLPDILIGLMIAGIFASTLSTIDSQILVCSATLTDDLLSVNANKTYLVSKIATIFLITLTFFIALFSSESVFQLTVIAWSALAAVFGPLVILKCMKKVILPNLTILMMGSAFITVIFWRFYSGLAKSVHEALPGFLVPFMFYFLLRKQQFNKS